MTAFGATAHTKMKEPMIGVTIGEHEMLFEPEQAMRLRAVIGSACATLYRLRGDIRERDGWAQCVGCGKTLGHEPAMDDGFNNTYHEACDERYR